MERFVADTDMADAIRLEVSVITPAHEARFRHTNQHLISADILTRYGEYMPEDALQRTQQLHERIFVTDHELYDGFSAAWPSLSMQEPSEGATFMEGNIVVIPEPLETTRRIVASFTEEGVDTPLSEEETLYLALIMFTNVVVHEAIHAAHNQRLREAFAEYGTRYYSVPVLRDMGIDPATLGETDRAQAHMFQLFCAHMKDTTGSEVPIHTAFFGREADEAKISDIQYKFMEFHNNLLKSLRQSLQ